MAVINKDVVLAVSLVLSVVSLVLLFGVTWYFQSSLDLLQQQVEYDRELLFELQERISLDSSLKIKNGNDIVKRQTENDCKCKDGLPGPKGSPGSKGVQGKRGKKGSEGKKGDIGPRGAAGEKGEIGETGPRGDPGDRGPRGVIGDTGLRGPAGEAGIPGTKGDQGPVGIKGDKGSLGSKGEMGHQGLKGDKGDKGIKGDLGETGYQGLKGEKGITGLPGSTGPKGALGQKGMKGDKEERNGGTVYVRWGHDQCPSTAQLVYSGRVGGPHFFHGGGGSNPQCLPNNPTFLTPISGTQYRSYMYGAEYETHTNSHSYLHGRQDFDIPCAVCYVTQRSTVYMVPAKYTCPTGWTKEYYGYLMTSYHTGDRSRLQYTCMDIAFKKVSGSSANKDGLLFYFVEGRCGALPCPPYDETREFSCAICTK